MKQEPLIKTIFKRLKKKLSGKMLIVLIVTLAANTFAWFIYTNQVQSGIEARVKAWNIAFEVDGGSITEYIHIDVDELYPGKNFSKTITIYNRGDTDANLSYEINSITLFGVQTTYTAAQNQNVATLLATIQQDYPFTITPSFSDSSLQANSSETFSISIVWPFESGNDSRDTLWGSRAYTYSQNYPNLPSMQISMKIVATQVAQQNNNNNNNNNNNQPEPTPEP